MRKLKIILMAMSISAMGFALENQEKIEKNKEIIIYNEKMIEALRHDSDNNFDGTILLYEAEIEKLKEENEKLLNSTKS